MDHGWIMKPQDLLVTLFLAAREEDGPPTFVQLGQAVGLSHGEAHNACRRAVRAGLLHSLQGLQVNRAALLEFLVHGVQYVFPAELGKPGRGVPTAHSVEPLAVELTGDQLPLVWPWARGEVHGDTLAPLYLTVPEIAAGNPSLHVLLALVDALRVGRARERSLAAQHLRRLLKAGPARGPRARSTHDA
jgi:hypothetical protein